MVKNNCQGKGVIVLHQFPRIKYAPSPSPFPIKLETFLRMNKLPYEPDFKQAIGPLGKSPWITDDDGEAVSDSQLIIEHLTRKHNIQMLKLTPEEVAVERALRATLEDNFYFVMISENAIHYDVNLQLRQFPRLVPAWAPNFLQTFIVKQVRKNIRKQAQVQGMGKHKREDLHHIGLTDLETIAAYLGSKPYIMGNAPSLVDCTAFGFLVLIFYVFPPDYFFRKECERRFPNLRSYVERIRKTYWPDWEEILAKD